MVPAYSTFVHGFNGTLEKFAESAVRVKLIVSELPSTSKNVSYSLSIEDKRRYNVLTTSTSPKTVTLLNNVLTKNATVTTTSAAITTTSPC